MVKIQESNNRLFLTIPKEYAELLKLSKGDKLLPFVNDKGNLEYRKIEK